MFDPADSPLPVDSSPGRVWFAAVVIAVALGFFLGFHLHQVMP